MDGRTVKPIATYLMGLDALDTAGEVKVEIKLVNVHGFVLVSSRFFLALDSVLLLFFL